MEDFICHIKVFKELFKWKFDKIVRMVYLAWLEAAMRFQ
jgi:hypothetical protein